MGIHKKIESPEKLLEYFRQYKDYEENNRLHKIEYVGREGMRVETPLHYPLSMEAFKSWLFVNGIISDLSDYVKNKDGRYSDFTPIITHIKEFIFAHNFKGASVQLLNPNLIARQLGIKEQTDVTSDNEKIHSLTKEITVNVVLPKEEDEDIDFE